jgi:hypothetical protein
MVFGFIDEFFRRTNVGLSLLQENLKYGLTADKKVGWLVGRLSDCAGTLICKITRLQSAGQLISLHDV